MKIVYLTVFKNDTDNKDLLMVNDFWDQVGNNRKWRIWKDLGHSEESPLKAKANSLVQDLEHRRILVSSLPHQLRWGRNTKGNIILKKAKQIDSDKQIGTYGLQHVKLRCHSIFDSHHTA